jgi:hypothetical protein
MALSKEGFLPETLRRPNKIAIRLVFTTSDDSSQEELSGAVPKRSKGKVCKTLIRGFESRPRLKLRDVVGVSW